MSCFPSHLVVVAANYPSPAQPACGTFVREFAHAVARQGGRCTVIHPVAFHRAWREKGHPFHSQEEDGGGNRVDVFRPRFLSLSTREIFARLGPLNPSRFTLSRFAGAVRRILRTQRIHPDVLYGHFFFPAGVAAMRIGREMGLPAFPGMGESVKEGKVIWTLRSYGLCASKKAVSQAPGVIVNSSLLGRMVARQLSVPEVRIGVFPNGIDRSRFYPREKKTMRKELGLPLDGFLVGCTGHFSDRKGQLRVLEAIRTLDSVRGVFIGGGLSLSPEVPVAFNQEVAHEQVPRLLSACDVFVLPTLEEGSCNAILEAMACGLPIISSTGEFNDDLLDESMSIRVDPMDVSAIRQAIVKLRDDPSLRVGMAAAAHRHSLRFDIHDRVRRMLAFMSKQSMGTANVEVSE